MSGSLHSMLIMDEIRDKISRGQYEFTQHAVDQSIIRRITLQELREVMAVGDIIEDYPNDKYGPSCLVFGVTSSGRPMHIQCTYPSRPLLKIITLYEPDPRRWVALRVRRRSDEQ